MNHVSVLFSLIVALSLISRSHAQSDSSVTDYPDRPIRIVVPYGAGGGTDTFVRTLQKGIIDDDLLPQPLVIINQPGGSGTIGSRVVKDAEPDGYTLLCQHNAIITAKFSGVVDYGPEAFDLIATTGTLSMVVICREDASYRNLKDLLEAAAERPTEVRFGANQGSPAYFTTLQLQNTVPGAKFSIVSTDGGADRYTKILGQHLDAGIFSLSEYLDFLAPDGTPPDQNVRALAILDAKRHRVVSEIPTAVEQEIPVLLNNAHYWWAPIGTPSGIKESLADVLQQAMSNELVQSELRRLRIDPVFEDAKQAEQRILETAKSFEKVKDQPPPLLPNFSGYVVGIVIALLGLVVVETLYRSSPQGSADDADPPNAPEYRRQHRSAAICLLFVVAYVVTLSLQLIPFPIASALMMIAVGSAMMEFHWKRFLILVALAFAIAYGIVLIFTHVLNAILPG